MGLEAAKYFKEEIAMSDPVMDDYNRSHVIHNGQLDPRADIAGYAPLNVHYVVDKDGNIHQLVQSQLDALRQPTGPFDSVIRDNTIDLVDSNGHVIKSGSQEAKDIFNKTDPNDPNKF